MDVGRDGALVVTVALAPARALLGLADALCALLSVVGVALLGGIRPASQTIRSSP